MHRLFQAGGKWLWAALLLLLPITSMPAVRDLVHSSVVAAPSVLILALLFVGWLIPYLVKGGRLPFQTVPLLAFFCCLVVSFGAGLSLNIPPLKEAGPFAHSVTALITLVVGLCFFLLPGVMVSDEESLRSALRWINLGGMLILGWSFFQAAVWFGQGHYWNWMRDFQDLISLGPLYRGRVTGFALEPSFLAHQLNMLYLPIWLASTIKKFSVYRFRLAGITLENMLAAGGCLTLALSFSRIGWLGFFLVLTYLFIVFNIRLIRWLNTRMRNRLMTAAAPVLLAIIYVGGAVGAAFVMSRIDPRMKDLFKPSFWQQDTTLVLANDLQFGERVVYWQAGWQVFNDHPWLGVGPGNAGYYFTHAIPSFGWELVEVRQLMFRDAEIPNTKNLWIRLLSESGIIGFAVFLSFCVVILLTAKYLLHQSSRSGKMMGLMAVFVLIGLTAEGFSIDSFALPYYWISFGMVSIAGSLAAGGRLVESEPGLITARDFTGEKNA